MKEYRIKEHLGVFTVQENITMSKDYPSQWLTVDSEGVGHVSGITEPHNPFDTIEEAKEFVKAIKTPPKYHTP